jgi:hypothetical protein
VVFLFYILLYLFTLGTDISRARTHTVQCSIHSFVRLQHSLIELLVRTRCISFFHAGLCKILETNDRAVAALELERIDVEGFTCDDVVTYRQHNIASSRKVCEYGFFSLLFYFFSLLFYLPFGTSFFVLMCITAVFTRVIPALQQLLPLLVEIMDECSRL